MYGDVVFDVACDDDGVSVAEREGRLQPSSAAENQRCAAIWWFRDGVWWLLCDDRLPASGENKENCMILVML
ncbi:hypothetical protein HanIR_Chr15g0775421 [Helianthus annuus]|nr:hypothetical protein HanIR_Chr15g0775421 [Helianthus annuus]